MNDPLIVTLVTIALIVLSAIFVITEFALLGARRHRLQELAPTSSGLSQLSTAGLVTAPSAKVQNVMPS